MSHLPIRFVGRCHREAKRSKVSMDGGSHLGGWMGGSSIDSSAVGLLLQMILKGNITFLVVREVVSLICILILCYCGIMIRSNLFIVTMSLKRTYSLFTIKTLS